MPGLNRDRLRQFLIKPDGTPQKLLDVSRLAALGRRYGINLQDGIRAAYADYRASR